MNRIVVAGAGPVGRATAAFLAREGHEVALWSPSGAGVEPLAIAPGRARIRYSGVLTGEAEVGIVASPEEFAGFDTVLIALPGNAYPVVLPRLFPYLDARQTVIVSGALSLSPLWIRERAGRPGDRPRVASWGTTLGTARRTAGTDVEINTLRARFDVAAIPAAAGEDVLATCRAFFGDRFEPAESILATALVNVNPIAHAAEVLANLSRIDRAEDWPLFACLTPAAGRIAEALDAERLAIARAFGLTVRSYARHTHLSYHVPEASVAEMMAAVHARDGSPPGPRSFEHRYLVEDVPYGLAFYEAMAAIAGVSVPHLTAVVTLLSTACHRDFRAENALLPQLRLEGSSPQALIERCRGAA